MELGNVFTLSGSAQQQTPQPRRLARTCRMTMHVVLFEYILNWPTCDDIRLNPRVLGHLLKRR